MITVILAAAVVASIVACIRARRPIILVSLLTLSIIVGCVLQHNPKTQSEIMKSARSETITQHTVDALLRPRS